MFRSTGLRLAALFTLAFAVCGGLLAVAILLAARAELAQDFDRRVRTEMDAMAQEFTSEGLEGVSQAVDERDRTPGAMMYGLEKAAGAPMAGRLDLSPRTTGWSNGVIQEAGHPVKVRMFTAALPSGELLTVGDAVERIAALDEAILRSFGWAFAASLIIGAAGGLLLGRDLQARLSAMTQTAGAIAEGDMTRRAPVRRKARAGHDDLDAMAQAFNAMLDRIGELMDSLRQVTTDVAHDLRTPLARLRQKLEAGLVAPPEAKTEAMESALADLDSILETFAALLRIAQVEGGARRAAFRALDLRDLVRQVAEAFSPSAEESGRRLEFDVPARAMILGDHELLTQMLVNLVENALRHTPPGALIRITLAVDERNAILRVIDNGPGIPPSERAKVFDRFYRLEQSRTTPGSGLGLPLAAAIARLHGGEIELADAGPGLTARVSLPRE
ncbi:MAG: sensor histidine kinase [Caulobacteraceae bacterium]|nr:sensor histidine kinase [Caulobacteraceae bacterium]